MERYWMNCSAHTGRPTGVSLSDLPPIPGTRKLVTRYVVLLLTLEIVITTTADNILNLLFICFCFFLFFFLYFSEKIRCDISCELSGRQFTSNAQTYFPWQVIKRKIWMLSATILLSFIRDKQDICNIVNYIHVSLTYCMSSCFKTLEHTCSNMKKHLASKSILADCQNGFRSRVLQNKVVQFVHALTCYLSGASKSWQF